MRRLDRRYRLEPDLTGTPDGGWLCTVLQYTDNCAVLEADAMLIGGGTNNKVLAEPSSVATRIFKMENGLLGVRLYSSWTRANGRLIKSTAFCQAVIYPEGWDASRR